MPETPRKAAATKKKAAAKHVARATPATTATVFTDRRIALLVAFLAILVGALTAATVSGVYESRSNGDVLKIVKDSVDPGGKRFQRGQDQTAGAVRSINEISVLAAYCAHRSSDLPSIQACVLSEYGRAHPTTTTAVP